MTHKQHDYYQEFVAEKEALEKQIPQGEKRTAYIKLDGYIDLNDSDKVFRPSPPDFTYAIIPVTIVGNGPIVISPKNNNSCER